MKALITKVSDIPADQSVVCITGSNEIPAELFPGERDRKYASERLESGEDIVWINTYDRFIYIVKTKEGPVHHRVREELRRSACKVKKMVKLNKHEELAITSFDTYNGAVLDFAEGFALASYSFEKYKSKETEKSKSIYPSKLFLQGDISDSDLRWLSELTSAVFFARDLINEPVNHLNAVALAGELRKTGEQAGFSVEVLNKGRIEALKMGGLLAVNRGSVDPPSFSILEWKPDNHVNPKPIVLVGKGIVYDTGGLNLKPGESMAGMKGDMAGAAIVNGILYTVASMGLPLHVIGLVPATDNRPGGNAYTQGDVITMHNKLTVEIGNTDAEGRLILADAISYASRFEPELIIDIATLTGSAAMTFGNQAIAVMTNAERRYIDLLRDCGEEVYERIGELPFFDEYAEGLKSDIADIKNIGNSREAGAILAGKFLEKFAEYPLIHLDIAGTEFLKKEDYYRPKNGTASSLRLLSTFLKRLVETYKR
jgi:leucyl aminopeptidase